MGTVVFSACNGAQSTQGFVSVCDPDAILRPSHHLATSRVRTTSSSTSSSTTITSDKLNSSWVQASATSSKAPRKSQSKPSSQPPSTSESFVEGMRRVLGSLHIKGVSADKLHRGKTQRQDAPFASCTIQHSPPLNVLIIGSGFGE